MAKNEGNDLGTEGSAYAKYSGMAIQMIVIIGVMTFAGYKIDMAAAHKTMWVTAVTALSGVFISLYLVFRGLKD